MTLEIRSCLNPGSEAAAFKRDDMESGMRDFGTAVLVRDVYCRLDAARLEQMRANLIRAELLGAWLAPLMADQLLRHGSAHSSLVSSA